MARIKESEIMERMEKNNRFDGLNAAVAAAAKKLIHLSYKEGINIQITTGFRSNAESNLLYTQGRTTAQVRAEGIPTLAGRPGLDKVSNASGGESYHNYGLAIDYVLLSDNGNTAIWTVNAKWKRVAAIGKALGFKWGGDWTGGFKDNPHLEMTFGLSIKDLQNGKRPTAKQTAAALAKVQAYGTTAKPAAVKEPVKKAAAKKPAASKTPAAIPAYPGSAFRIGDGYSKDIERIQRAVGIKESEVDGYYGKDTAKKVKAYQERKKLEADGVTGKDTWNRLF